MKSLRVLALEPWYGGSHRAFLDGWAAHSRHAFSILGLKPHHWKWRMRHAAVTFAERLATEDPDVPFDVVLATSMLSVAEFRGLAPARIARLPHLLYLHENQLTYPVREERERDLQLAFTNLSSALAADALWFNSSWHLEDLLGALEVWMARMPDHAPRDLARRLGERAAVHPPGLDLPALISDEEAPPGRRSDGPLHLAWAARWEHDKGPEILAEALDRLPSSAPWRLSLLGQRFPKIPPALEALRRRHRERLVHDGGPKDRARYLEALAGAEVFVSTAHHEFFGIAAAEALALGCCPLLPDRLAYPELLAAPLEDARPWLYDGTPAALAKRLTQWIARHERGEDLPQARAARARARSLAWSGHAPRLDAALEEMVARSSPRDAPPLP